MPRHGIKTSHCALADINWNIVDLGQKFWQVCQRVFRGNFDPFFISFFIALEKIGEDQHIIRALLEVRFSGDNLSPQLKHKKVHFCEYLYAGRHLQKLPQKFSVAYISKKKLQKRCLFQIHMTSGCCSYLCENYLVVLLG